MRSTNWMTPFVTVLVCASMQAQVSLAPRRLSPSFAGQVPLLWQVEGNGALRGAKFQLLDDGGREISAWQDFQFRSLGAGRWQAWSLEVPGQRFKNTPLGRYTLMCRMVWEQNGKLRTEETESTLVFEGVGDGWLQKAYQSMEASLVALTVEAHWQTGGILNLKAAALRGLQKIQYQVIAGANEEVLRPWAELPMKGQTSWALKGDPRWPEGPATLWVLLEGTDGTAWVESRELWLGRRAQTGGRPQASSGITKSTNALKTISVTASAAYVEAPTVANAEWLRGIDDPGKPLAWDMTNRVATVNVGYWDMERNETSLFPTAVQTQWRPMSVSLSGANGLGKPLYGVSYLLAPGMNLDTVVEEATRGTFALPQGAKFLQVGSLQGGGPTVVAPVVFSAGTVEDFQGKPLAAGYAWVATTADAGAEVAGNPPVGSGPVISAWDWSQPTNGQTPQATAPPVGVNAIQAAARFRANMQASIKADLGSTNLEADLDANRDPYALTFASPDPMGRGVIGKGLGSRKPESLDTAFPVIKTPMGNLTSNLSDSFDQELSGWYTLNSGAVHVFDPVVPTNGAIQLGPEYTLTLGSWIGYYSHHYDPGILTANLGMLAPGGGSLVVKLNYKGPMKARILDDDGVEVWSEVYSSTTQTAMPSVSLGSGSSIWSPTGPTSLHLVVTNSTPSQTLNVGQVPAQSSYLTIDDLSVDATQAYQGLTNPEDALDSTAYPTLPGYTRTQFGTVDGSGSSLEGYSVTQVTDPDGSGVAEIKDFEGRTVLKIVNPDATYTAAFKEYRLNGDGTRKAFRPSAPRTRGLVNNDSSGPQINLVTQYAFDAEGHLRVVIPPKGLSTNAWGLSLTDANIDTVLSAATTDFSGVAGRAQTLAKYATFNAYDYAGHLMATYNPDEGLTRFLVDQKGRVHYSQTEKQRAAGTWTRTLYDGVFRVLAVGELNSTIVPIADLETIPTFDPTLAAFTTALGTLNPSSRSQNKYDSYIDMPFTVVNGNRVPFSGLTLDQVKALPGDELWGAFSDGHLTMTTDPGATERYFYDQDGRIVIRWVSLNPAGGTTRHFTIGIFYDFAGRVKRIVYPSGPSGDPLQVVYSYDDLGRLYAVGTPADGAYFARYSYYPTGEVKAIVYGPGKGLAAKQMLQDPQGWLRSLKVQGR